MDQGEEESKYGSSKMWESEHELISLMCIPEYCISISLIVEKAMI